MQILQNQAQCFIRPFHWIRSDHARLDWTSTSNRSVFVAFSRGCRHEHSTPTENETAGTGAGIWFFVEKLRSATKKEFFSNKVFSLDLLGNGHFCTSASTDTNNDRQPHKYQFAAPTADPVAAMAEGADGEQCGLAAVEWREWRQK